MDEPQPVVYDELDVEEIRRDHAHLSYIHHRLHRAVGLMTNDMATSMAGREVITTMQRVEQQMTRMQAAIRRLEVPES